MIEIKNARIESTMLGYEDHGILSSFIHLDYGNSSGQGFGGYMLGGPATDIWVKGILKVVGVDKWEDLKGKHIRVEADHAKIHKIGHLLEDKWFDPAVEFKKLEK